MVICFWWQAEPLKGPTPRADERSPTMLIEALELFIDRRGVICSGMSE